MMLLSLLLSWTCTMIFGACSEEVAVSFDALPNNAEDSRPDPWGTGGGCSLARAGFGEGTFEGVPDDAFLA